MLSIEEISKGYPESGWIPQEQSASSKAMKAYTFLWEHFLPLKEDRKGAF